MAAGAESDRSSLCPACGTPAAHARARFCFECGAELAGAPPTQTGTVERLTADPASAGEHKFATVLFADIKGSTEMAGDVDPEDWFDALSRFHTEAVSAVHDHGGVVASYAGDGVTALFGAPVAHEHHAHQACYAAVDLMARVAALADELQARLGRRLAVRVGLNSGAVVVGRVGEGARVDFSAQGLPVHIAARMEQIAEPGQVLAALSTVELAGDRFHFVPVGLRSVKGVAEPIDVAMLVGPVAARPPAGQQTPFVGRDAVLDDLAAQLAGSAAGARVVLLEAEAGIGKTRLLSEFLARVGPDVPVAAIAADTVRTSTPLTGVRDLVSGLVAPGSAAGFDEVQARLADTGLDPERWRTALEFVFAPAFSMSALGPEAALREVTAFVDTVVQTVGSNAPHPLVVVVDDYPALDRLSLDVICSAIAGAPDAPILWLLAGRSPIAGAVPIPVGTRHLLLPPLTRTDTALLLEALVPADDRHHDRSVMVERIHEHTGGNAFFVEQIARTLTIGGGDEPAIPERVQAVIAARMDRLPPADRDLVLAASVIGLRFDVGMLASLVESPEPTVAAALQRLRAAGLMDVDGTGSWCFRHRITQQVAYDAQMRHRRRGLHGRAATALAALADADHRASTIAEHFDQADESDQAVDWYRRAGLVAARTDPPGARRLLERARHLSAGGAGGVPAAMLVRAELLLQAARCGSEPDSVAAVLTEIRTLGAGGDQDALLAFGLLRGWYALSGAGQSVEARSIAHEAVEVADRSGIAVIQIGARLTRASNGNASGSLAEHLAGCDDIDARLGAAGLAHPDSQLHGQARYTRGVMLLRMGRRTEAEAALREAVDIAERANDPMWRVLSRAGLALALAPAPEARQLVYESIELAETIAGSGEMCIAMFSAARIELAAGRPDVARELLSKVLDTARSLKVLTSEEYILAEFGEAHRCCGDLAAAEALAREAVALSSGRGNHSFELSASLTLARVLLDIGAYDAAELEQLIERAGWLLEYTGFRELAPALAEVRARSELGSRRAAP